MKPITDQEIEAMLPIPEVPDQELYNSISQNFPDIQLKYSSENTRNGDATIQGAILINDQTIEVPRFFLAFLHHLLLNNQATKNKKARIRRTIGNDRPLAPEEINFLGERTPICKKEIEHLLGYQIEESDTPHIALVGSGGGFRAMLSTAGACSGLFESNLLHTLEYIGGVSGSTWFISAWLASKEPFDKFYPAFKKRVADTLLHEAFTTGCINILTFIGIITETFIRRLAYREVPTIIDLYGLLLGLELFDPHSKENYAECTLSSRANYVMSGQFPMPICMSVQPYNNNTKFHEIEFTPFEVLHYGINGACPTFGFGRKFKCGKSTTNHPALTLGYLMGIWGSAFTLALKQIFPMIAHELKPSFLFKPLTMAITETPLGDFQLFPSYIRNPVRHFQNGGDANSKFHIHIDAGAQYNIPIQPILRKERNLEMIIIVEASGNCKDAPNLTDLEKEARAAGRPFPVIDYEKAKSQPYTIFNDGLDANTPIIVYLPLAKNDAYDASFDPQALLANSGDFLNTGNFAYTPAQIELLTGLMAFNAKAAVPEIKQAIETLIQRKHR